MEILSESPTEIIINFPNLSTPFLSAIRRIIISEVETLAIDTVDFYINESIFPDEYIAHRLGLIVLDSTVDCEEDNYGKIVIDVTGRVNNSEDGHEKVTTITSGDLDCSNCITNPVNKNIPILKLKEGQRIKFVANIRKSNGLEHSKWIPVCPAFVDGQKLIVESTGGISPREIVNRGLKTLEKKLKHFVVVNEVSETSEVNDN